MRVGDRFCGRLARGTSRAVPRESSSPGLWKPSSAQRRLPQRRRKWLPHAGDIIAAIGENALAGHEARLVRTQPDRDVTDILRLCDAL